MKFLLRLIGLLLLPLVAFDGASYANAFIVPEELPSILSLVYSNIPPIKKGTDSRLGFGFRLGDHADFQVQFEIGPQQRTRPIGSLSGSSKRDVDTDDYLNKKPTGAAGSRNPGKSWLETWSKETKQKQQFNKEKHRDALSGSASQTSTSGPAAGMPASPMINESAFNQLQQLYDMNKPKEDPLGTIAASELEQRLKELQQQVVQQNGIGGAQKRVEVVFKPMPVASDIEATNEVEPRVPFKPLPTRGVMSRGTRPTPASTTPTTRWNVRRRTNPGATPNRGKDRISADLADVSLD